MPRSRGTIQRLSSASGGRLLATEVVDDQDPAVGLELQGGVVHAAGTVEAQVELLGGELAAGQDHGAPAQDPARVEALGLGVDGAVQHRVVHGDDLPVDLDGVGDQDRVVPVGPDQALGDRRLAGAGGAVQEDGAARSHRRAELVDQVVADHQVGERLPHVVVIDRRAGPLQGDHGGVVVERHGCGTGVAAHRHALGGLLVAGLGEAQPVAAALQALDVQEVLGPQVGHHRVHHLGADGERLGQVERRGLAVEQRSAQDEVAQQPRRGAEVVDGGGDRRRDRHVRSLLPHGATTHVPVLGREPAAWAGS